MRFAALFVMLTGCAGPAPVAPEPPPLESHFPLAAATDAEVCLALADEAHAAATATDATPRRKVIVSDLHLGPGTGQGRRFDGIEDFTSDAAFGRLAARLAERPTELIVAGDFIEFWQIEEALGLLPEKTDEQGARGVSQKESLAAFDVARAAHPEVFAALAAFLARGDNRLVFIVGNHDEDLVWPRVQLAVARALGLRDRSRIAFVKGAYADRGVLVAHGHEFDPANTSGPVALDENGTCRLAASWGLIFVAKFLGALEQEFPFVDNLYPESSALLWGVADEPDASGPIAATYRLLAMLIVEQTGALNLEALRASALVVLDAPDDARGDWGTVWDRLPGTESALRAIELVATDPEFSPLRDRLIIAASALPDVRKAVAALSGINHGLLSALKERLSRDAMETAATEFMAVRPDISVVVYGHTHVPGGKVSAVEGGFYANSGTWTPIGEVAALKAGGIRWTDLKLADSRQFPRAQPAIVIDYDGAKPRAPHIVYAE